MKIDLILPNGGELHIERKPKQPMSDERFNAVCGVLYVLLGISAFLGFFLIAFG